MSATYPCCIHCIHDPSPRSSHDVSCARCDDTPPRRTRIVVGVEGAEADVRYAEMNLDARNNAACRAMDDVDDAKEKLAAARHGLNRARLIAGACPICDAGPNRPCVGIGSASHSARLTASIQANASP